MPQFQKTARKTKKRPRKSQKGRIENQGKLYGDTKESAGEIQAFSPPIGSLNLNNAASLISFPTY